MADSNGTSTTEGNFASDKGGKTRKATFARRNSNSALQTLVDPPEESLSPEIPLLCDDDDQDVIDCTTSDIDSDVEVKSTRKPGAGTGSVIQQKTASEKKRDDPAPPGDTSNAIDKSLDEVSSDEDMFEMMKETPPRETTENPQIIQPAITPAVETEAEADKLINAPLRKEVVPEITISDDEDNQVLQTTSQESLSLQIDICLNAASEAISKRKAIDSEEEPAQKVGNEMANVTNQNGPDNDDDPLFNKIPLNMYQNFGDLDYEPDDDEHRSPVRVKTELGTVAERMGRLDVDNIPIIDLLSSDEELPKNAAVEPETVKSGRKRNRKKRSSTSDGCLQLKHISSEESFSKSSQSEKSLISMSPILSLEELHSDDRRMSLRKRTITVLPGTVLSTSGRKNKMMKLFNDPESINEALRKSARRTPSKMSLASTESSVGDDQIPAEASTSKISQVIAEEPRADKSDDQIGREQSSESFDLEQAIAKELEKEASDSRKSLDIPVAATDIALEDMLGMFEKEEEEKTSDLFHSRSTEENIWMEHFVTENDENAQTEEVSDPQNEIQNSAIEENNLPIVARYTVYEPDPNNPEEPAAIVAEAETGQHHIVQQPADEANQKKLQRFKIVQNISKYPPPQKAPKTRKRAKKATAGVKTRQKGKRRASNDDSDYTPEPSYARTRRISTRTRKPPASRTRDSFVPTGEYLSESSELLQHTQSEPPELEQPPLAPEGSGGTMSMPSLEEDLAMTSSPSESSVTMAQPSGCSLHVPAEGQQSVELIAEDNGKSAAAKEKEPRKKPVPGRKRGRPRVLQQQISDFFCPTSGDQQGTCKASCCQVKPTPNEKSKAAAPAKPTSTKVTRRRKIVISSSSEDETGSMSFSGASTTAHSASTCTTGEDDSTMLAGEESSLSVTENAAAAPKDGLKIVLSPLTAEQIRIINTPRKTPKLSKTTQTEIGGLTVKIPWERINFSSQYFVNLRMLLSRGANRPITGQVASSNGRVQRRLENNFELVTIPNREAVGADSPSPPPPPIPVLPRSGAGRDRSIIDDLLYHRADGEIPLPPTSNSEDRRSSMQIIKSVNSNFRIPKLCKQPSTSPEVVTSSTSHVNEQQEAPPVMPQNRSEVPKYQPDPSSAANQDGGGGYNNDDPGEGCSNLSRRRPSHSDRVSPMRFANALNSGYRPAVIIRKEEEPRNVGPSYVRSGLPDRADLVNVKRTIQNDTPQVQPQQQQQLQQPRPTSAEMNFKPPLSYPSFGSFEPQPPQQYGAIAGSSFNRGYAGFPPAFPVDNAAAASIFGMNAFSNLGLLEMFMLYQMRQQQQQSIIGNPFAGQPQALQPSLARPTQPTTYSQQMGLPANIPSAEPLLSSNEDTEMVSFLFGCQDFHTGSCNNPHCRRSHALPNEAEVHQKLLNQSQNFIMVTYQFVASLDSLFNKYFPVYASVMGKHHMRHQLVNTIADCEKPGRPFQYYRLIVEGLQMSGTSISAAVQIVIDRHIKKNFRQVNVLVDLIINTGDGIPNFLEKLNEFLELPTYEYELAAVNRLIEACIRFERPPIELLKFVSKLVLNVGDADIQLVNATALLEFVNKVRQVPDLALEVGEIVGKYGRVEVAAIR